MIRCLRNKLDLKMLALARVHLHATKTVKLNTIMTTRKLNKSEKSLANLTTMRRIMLKITQ